jgi:hypothetical protein
MIKDIEFYKVEDVALAIVPDKEEIENAEWSVYLVNLNVENLEGVIVSSRGYGNIEGKEIKTTTLRQFFESILTNDYVKVELIDKQVFGINNEYWVSFWIKGKMFDKKYVFVSESIQPINFTDIPLLGKRGVMII